MHGVWLSIGCLPPCESRAKLYDENQRALGTVHLRQSVHNPNIALNMQSYVPGGCKSMAKDLHDR